MNGFAAFGDGLDLALGQRPNHRDVEHFLLENGWVPCGAGDWAIALRSPDGAVVARISPFDPVGPFTAEFYREAASTHQVPELHDHRRLDGGGDLQIIEWLLPVSGEEATGFLLKIAKGSPEVDDLAGILRGVHDRAKKSLPWCGPLDDNPHNVMRTRDGRLVLTDPFYADGPNLYAAAATTPGLVAARIPKAERKYITEIPLAGSGGWDEGGQEKIRQGLMAADAEARRWAKPDGGPRLSRR